jgi:outer membrane lipoprotein-sorting protein
MDTLHMIFTQEKHLRVLQRPIVSHGELWLKGQTLLYHLKNTAGAIELVVRIDDTAMQTYYPMLQSLEVIERQTVPLSLAPMPFISGDLVALTQAYDSELFESAGHYTLKLTPKPSDPNASFAAIWLRLEAFHIRELTQVEKNGDRVVMKISAFNPNIAISDAQLALHLPAGTKVVYPLQ